MNYWISIFTLYFFANLSSKSNRKYSGIASTEESVTLSDAPLKYDQNFIYLNVIIQCIFYGYGEKFIIFFIPLIKDFKKIPGEDGNVPLVLNKIENFWGSNSHTWDFKINTVRAYLRFYWILLTCHVIQNPN